MEPTRIGPLFIVTGASGVGKTTLCEALFQRETNYLVLDSDLLWEPRYDTPEDNYRAFREKWLTLCASISQGGRPVVLVGAGVPDSFEVCKARQYFTKLFYLAVVAKSEVLDKRMRRGRGITDEKWLKSSRDFNLWLQAHAAETKPPITLLDHSRNAVEEDAGKIDAWIQAHLQETL